MGLLVDRVREPEKDYSAEKARCAMVGHQPTKPGYCHYIEQTMDYICPRCKTPYSRPMTQAEVVEMMKMLHPDSWVQKMDSSRVH